MWSRRVLLVTLVAAAAVTMTNVPATAIGMAQAKAPFAIVTSFR